MNEKLVTVARFSDYMEAELAKQLLEGEGITAFVMGQHGSAINVGVPGIADIQLQTPESQVARAMEVLESAISHEAEDSEQDELEGSGDFEDEDENDLEEQE
jgi:hypothetical protein